MLKLVSLFFYHYQCATFGIAFQLCHRNRVLPTKARDQVVGTRPTIGTACANR